jgi:hypothetical protein
MPSSAALRKQIETEFQHRYPSVLTPIGRTIREVATTGIAEVDELLNGGLPIGAISELTGPISSGRTSIALAFLAQQTRAGSVCAWIDAADTLDPESAAANGICLEKLLWIRCSSVQNQSNLTRRAGYKTSQPWVKLDQAIRATDLLLQSGGFAAIVLDLGNEKIEHGRRIPLATWFRFRQATDRTRSCLIVLCKSPYAQSSAAVVLECQPSSVESGTGTVVQRFSYSVQRRRERFSPITTIDRKPQASTWSAQTSWNAERMA